MEISFGSAPSTELSRASPLAVSYESEDHPAEHGESFGGDAASKRGLVDTRTHDRAPDGQRVNQQDDRPQAEYRSRDSQAARKRIFWKLTVQMGPKRSIERRRSGLSESPWVRMRSILDPAFRHVPSFATSVAATWRRVGTGSGRPMRVIGQPRAEGHELSNRAQ